MGALRLRLRPGIRVEQGFVRLDWKASFESSSSRPSDCLEVEASLKAEASPILLRIDAEALRDAAAFLRWRQDFTEGLRLCPTHFLSFSKSFCKCAAPSEAALPAELRSTASWLNASLPRPVWLPTPRQFSELEEDAEFKQKASETSPACGALQAGEVKGGLGVVSGESRDRGLLVESDSDGSLRETRRSAEGMGRAEERPFRFSLLSLETRFEGLLCEFLCADGAPPASLSLTQAVLRRERQTQTRQQQEPSLSLVASVDEVRLSSLRGGLAVWITPPVEAPKENPKERREIGCCPSRQAFSFQARSRQTDATAPVLDVSVHCAPLKVRAAVQSLRAEAMRLKTLAEAIMPTSREGRVSERTSGERAFWKREERSAFPVIAEGLSLDFRADRLECLLFSTHLPPPGLASQQPLPASPASGAEFAFETSSGGVSFCDEWLPPWAPRQRGLCVASLTAPAVAPREKRRVSLRLCLLSNQRTPIEPSRLSAPTAATAAESPQRNPPPEERTVGAPASLCISAQSLCLFLISRADRKRGGSFGGEAEVRDLRLSVGGAQEKASKDAQETSLSEGGCWGCDGSAETEREGAAAKASALLLLPMRLCVKFGRGKDEGGRGGSGEDVFVDGLSKQQPPADEDAAFRGHAKISPTALVLHPPAVEGLTSFLKNAFRASEDAASVEEGAPEMDAREKSAAASGPSEEGDGSGPFRELSSSSGSGDSAADWEEEGAFVDALDWEEVHCKMALAFEAFRRGMQTEAFFGLQREEHAEAPLLAESESTNAVKEALAFSFDFQQLLVVVGLASGASPTENCASQPARAGRGAARGRGGNPESSTPPMPPTSSRQTLGLLPPAGFKPRPCGPAFCSRAWKRVLQSFLPTSLGAGETLAGGFAVSLQLRGLRGGFRVPLKDSVLIFSSGNSQALLQIDSAQVANWSPARRETETKTQKQEIPTQAPGEIQQQLQQEHDVDEGGLWLCPSLWRETPLLRLTLPRGSEAGRDASSSASLRLEFSSETTKTTSWETRASLRGDIGLLEGFLGDVALARLQVLAKHFTQTTQPRREDAGGAEGEEDRDREREAQREEREGQGGSASEENAAASAGCPMRVEARVRCVGFVVRLLAEGGMRPAFVCALREDGLSTNYASDAAAPRRASPVSTTPLLAMVLRDAKFRAVADLGVSCSLQSCALSVHSVGGWEFLPTTAEERAARLRFSERCAACCIRCSESPSAALKFREFFSEPGSSSSRSRRWTRRDPGESQAAQGVGDCELCAPARAALSAAAAADFQGPPRPFLSLRRGAEEGDALRLASVHPSRRGTRSPPRGLFGERSLTANDGDLEKRVSEEGGFGLCAASPPASAEESAAPLPLELTARGLCLDLRCALVAHVGEWLFAARRRL